MTRPPHDLWYKTKQWQATRRAQLTREPLCAMCLRMDILTSATVVDHIRPHKGDPYLFWDLANLQSLCKPCHDRHKQGIEHGRKRTANGDDGWPRNFV